LLLDLTLLVVFLICSLLCVVSERLSSDTFLLCISDARSNYIEQADGTAKAQAKQLLDQFKRIKQLEEEIQHVKTTKMIDKIGHLPFVSIVPVPFSIHTFSHLIY
jgi:hypothetical protein